MPLFIRIALCSKLNTGIFLHRNNVGWLYRAFSFNYQSFVLKFCVYHRLPIYYILANDAVNTYDYFYGIEISDKGFLLLHIFLIWITILGIIWFYAKHHKKAAVKITGGY